MLLYRNHTRFSAIVTVKVEVGGDQLKEVLRVGADEVFELLKVAGGHHDVLVGPGREIHTVGDSPGNFVSARCAP